MIRVYLGETSEVVVATGGRWLDGGCRSGRAQADMPVRLAGGTGTTFGRWRKACSRTSTPLRPDRPTPVSILTTPT